MKIQKWVTQGEFCNEFNDYLQTLACRNCNIVIVGDFNIDRLNTITYMLWVVIQLVVFIDTAYSLIIPLSFNNVIIIYCVQSNKDTYI